MENIKYRSLLLVFVFELISAGGYGLYALVKNEILLRKSHDLSYKRVNYFILLLIIYFSIIFIMILGLDKQNPASMWGFFYVLLFLVIAIYSFAAHLAYDIAKLIRIHQKTLGATKQCSAFISILMTLFGFVSVFYFQSHLNEFVKLISEDRGRTKLSS